MKISFIKSPLPIIWLDTFIIFNMTKWKRGDSLDKTTSDRMEELYNLISELTKTNKLICPFADQREEIWIGRKECVELLLDISKGVKALYSEKIKDEQIFKFMQAYINNTSTVTVKYDEYFSEDPIKVINDKSDFKINVDLGLFEKPSDISERRKKQIIKLEFTRLNNIKNGKKYEDQLGLELNAEIKYLIESIQNIDQLSPINLLGVLDAFSQYMYKWESMGGKDDEFIKFFYSEFCHSVPFINISSMLSAYIITNTDTIQSSHYMDINHAASAMPYVNIYLTDRNMKHIIKKLEIDQKYECQVFSLADFNELISILKSFK